VPASRIKNVSTYRWDCQANPFSGIQKDKSLAKLELKLRPRVAAVDAFIVILLKDPPYRLVPEYLSGQIDTRKPFAKLENLSCVNGRAHAAGFADHSVTG